MTWDDIGSLLLARGVGVRASGDREGDEAGFFRARLIERDTEV